MRSGAPPLLACTVKIRKLFTVNLTREKRNTQRWGPRGKGLEGVRAHGGARAPGEGKNCLAYPLLFFLSKVSYHSLPLSLILSPSFVYTIIIVRAYTLKSPAYAHTTILHSSYTAECNTCVYTRHTQWLRIIFVYNICGVAVACGEQQLRNSARAGTLTSPRSRWSDACLRGTKINSPT